MVVRGLYSKPQKRSYDQRSSDFFRPGSHYSIAGCWHIVVTLVINNNDNNDHDYHYNHSQ